MATLDTLISMLLQCIYNHCLLEPTCNIFCCGLSMQVKFWHLSGKSEFVLIISNSDLMVLSVSLQEEAANLSKGSVVIIGKVPWYNMQLHLIGFLYKHILH